MKPSGWLMFRLSMLASLLPMTPIIRRVGPSVLDILAFSVCLCIPLAKECIMLSVMLVLSSVWWTLWTALLTLVLESPFPSPRRPNVPESSLAKDEKVVTTGNSSVVMWETVAPGMMSPGERVVQQLGTPGT